jgi:hypothetical protein
MKIIFFILALLLIFATTIAQHSSCEVVETFTCEPAIYEKQLINNLLSFPKVVNSSSILSRVTQAEKLLDGAYQAYYDEDDNNNAARLASECLDLVNHGPCLLLLLEVLDKQGLNEPARAQKVLNSVVGWFSSPSPIFFPSQPSEWRSIFSKYILSLHTLDCKKDIHFSIFDIIKDYAGWTHPWQICDGPMMIDDPAIEGIERRPRFFWSAKEFLITKGQLENHVFKAIKEELPNVEHLWVEHLNEEIKEGNKSKWQEIRLYEMSENLWSKLRCEAMPKTCSALQKISRLLQRVRPLNENVEELYNEPGINVPGRLSLLRLSPGSALVPHTGSSNARLSFHMGITLPPPIDVAPGVQSSKESSSLRVGNETVRWEVGKVLFWDDSFVHSVRNNHPSISRVVFTGHFFKPALTEGRVIVQGKKWELVPDEPIIEYGFVEDERRLLEN